MSELETADLITEQTFIDLEMGAGQVLDYIGFFYKCERGVDESDNSYRKRIKWVIRRPAKPDLDEKTLAFVVDFLYKVVLSEHALRDSARKKNLEQLAITHDERSRLVQEIALNFLEMRALSESTPRSTIP